MAAIVCELCGSNDIQKQDGVYVCQHCGTKYTVEEAKKLLGTVRIDRTEKVDSLFTLARRAKANSNAEDAEKYYDLIRQELPQNWEANFYAVYFKATNCKIADIASAAKSVSNCIHSTFILIQDSSLDDNDRISAVSDVCAYSYVISDMLYSAADSYYYSIDDSIRIQYSDEHKQRIDAAADIKKVVCDELCSVFESDKAVFTTVGFNYIKERIKKIYHPDRYIQAIRRYEPDFVDQDAEKKEAQYQQLSNELNNLLKNIEKTEKQIERSSSGCYVATAVYGSYDCPEVWTLRRYRDDTLASSWYGRSFIRLYYSISPTFVKWFGSTKWFKQLWKSPLDRMVKKLNSQGIPGTPYKDISFDN